MLGNPDADQVAADVVSFGEPVEGLAGQIVLDDLPLELDRIAAVLGHGLSPRKPGRNSLIRVTSPVHPVGCTPGYTGSSGRFCHSRTSSSTASVTRLMRSGETSAP